MVSVALSELWQWFTGASNHSYYNFACGGRQSCCFLRNLRRWSRQRTATTTPQSLLHVDNEVVCSSSKKLKNAVLNTHLHTENDTKRVRGMHAHSIQKRGHWSPTKNACRESCETWNGSACEYYTKERTLKSDKNWSPTCHERGTWTFMHINNRSITYNLGYFFHTYNVLN